MNGMLEREMKHEIPDLRVAGVVAMTPSSGNFNWHSLTGEAPILFVKADIDRAAPFGMARWRYDLLYPPYGYTHMQHSLLQTELTFIQVGQNGG